MLRKGFELQLSITTINAYFVSITDEKYVSFNYFELDTMNGYL